MGEVPRPGGVAARSLEARPSTRDLEELLSLRTQKQPACHIGNAGPASSQSPGHSGLGERECNPGVRNGSFAPGLSRPQEAARILAEAIDHARQAEIRATGAGAPGAKGGSPR